MHFSSVVTITSAALRLVGVGHNQKARALATLEKAGLITVSRTNGKNPQVTVLDLIQHFGKQKPVTKSRGES
jgi:hypothetical protein